MHARNTMGAWSPVAALVLLPCHAGDQCQQVYCRWLGTPRLGSVPGEKQQIMLPKSRIPVEPNQGGWCARY